MFDVHMQDPTRAFVACWVAAMTHLDACVQGGIRGWIKDYPGPPFLEHISFRLGNQLFYVRLVDADHREDFPGSDQGLAYVASKCAGHACLMPMRRGRPGGDWIPAADGWGLVDARSGRAVDPVTLVTDERVEMTAWECNDLAVQVVRHDLQARGCEIVSWSSNPDVDPALWFAAPRRDAEWVLVRFSRFPGMPPQRPLAKMRELGERFRVQSARGFSDRGHFAAVALRSDIQGMAPGDPVLPLWRGHAVWVDYESILQT